MTTEVKAPLHSGATCQEVSAVRKGRDDQLERCWKGSSAASDTVVPLVRLEVTKLCRLSGSHSLTLFMSPSPTLCV